MKISFRKRWLRKRPIRNILPTVHVYDVVDDNLVIFLRQVEISWMGLRLDIGWKKKSEFKEAWSFPALDSKLWNWYARYE